MLSERFPISPDSRRFYLGMGGLILATWAILAAWQHSAYAMWMSHEAIGDRTSFPLQLAAFLLSWVLMTVAMMLPGSLPLLKPQAHTGHNQAGSSQSAWLVPLGYLAPWVLFGLLVYLGDSLLHQVAHPGAPLAGLESFIAPLILLAAGLYQLTPLKRRMLQRCHPSHEHIGIGYAHPAGAAVASNHGLRIGLACLASCWPLLLLMSAVGHNRLDAMLFLGAIMAAERLSPHGRRLAWLVGFGLIVWAVSLVLVAPVIGHSHH